MRAIEQRGTLTHRAARARRAIRRSHRRFVVIARRERVSLPANRQGPVRGRYRLSAVAGARAKRGASSLTMADGAAVPPTFERGQGGNAGALARGAGPRYHLRPAVPSRRLPTPSHSTFAQILISRDGPMLKPGTRSYDRAWIRDGAMMSEALLRMGRADVAPRLRRILSRPSVRQRQGAVLRRFSRRRPGARRMTARANISSSSAELYRFTGDRAALAARMAVGACRDALHGPAAAGRADAGEPTGQPRMLSD